MAPTVLGYWNIRGRIQPTRLMLEYAGADWEDKLYSTGTAPNIGSSWFSEKETHGLDFPNLPWMKDGDIKMTQSEAIFRYAARKFNLVGQTEEEKYRADMVFEESKDIRASFGTLCYSPNFASLKEDFLKNVQSKLERLSKFLGDHPYFAGKNITFVDFYIYELLDQLKLMEPEILKKYKNFEDFLHRIENLGPIAAFIKSPKFIKYPLFGPMASFGG